MKLKKLYNFIIIFLVVTTACITPIDVTIDKEINVLVIDGFITTEDGPHEIRITRSALFGDIFVGTIELISGATVFVREGTGEVVELIEDRPGFYLTPDTFKGKVGSSYTLLVETNAGESYSSFPQTIAPSPAIEDVFFQFKSTPTLNPEVDNSGLDVLIEFQDPEDERNFYMWEIEGDYRIFSNPELFVNLETGQIQPKSCCNVCYVSDMGVAQDILSDVQNNGNRIVQKIGYLQDDRRRFQDQYRIHIKQYSLTEDAYEFFRVLRNQLEISGSIFDPPPATIGSNIINLNDPDAATIGYFGAFDVQNYDAFIDLQLIEEPRQDQVTNDDCRLVQHSTTTKPADWD